MKLSHIFWAIVAITFLASLYADPVEADGYNHNVEVNNYYLPEHSKSISDSQADNNTAKSTAAGQHNFKSTTDLQWSVGAGFSGDASALSFGLGLQTGKIFFSGNVTNTIFSDDSDPIVGLGAGGTF